MPRRAWPRVTVEKKDWVQLCWFGSAPIYDVAYTIGVDPDQDREPSGTNNTINSIEGQLSQGDNYTAVCAEGVVSGISMCLTTDIATSYAFDQESFGANVITTKQPITTAFHICNSP